MLKAVVRFADDTAGLEKALRLFQSFCTIAVGLATTAEDLAFWVELRAQFALGMHRTIIGDGDGSDIDENSMQADDTFDS